MAENLQRQPAIANLLDLDPLAVAPPVPQPRALADALQPRAFGLLPAAPQPSLPRHQPALHQMLLPTSQDPVTESAYRQLVGLNDFIGKMHLLSGDSIFESDLIHSIEKTKLEFVKSLILPIKETYKPHSILPTSVISELPFIVSLLTKEMLSNRSQKSGMFELAIEYINMRTMHEEDQIKKVLEALQPTIQALRSKVFSENPDLHMNAIKLIGALLSNTFIRHDVLRRTDMASTVMQALIWATQQKSRQMYQTGVETLTSFLEKMKQEEELLEWFLKTHYLQLLNHTISLHSQAMADCEVYHKLVWNIFCILDYGRLFGEEKLKRDAVMKHVAAYFSSVNSLDFKEVSSTVSQLIVSTRDETTWPKFTEKLRKLVGPVKAPRGKGDPEGSVEAVGLMYGGGVYLEATTSCRLKTSPGRSPSQKQEMEMFPEPGPSSSRTPQRKLRVQVVQSDDEEEEEEERKKKEKRKKATTFMKSPGRQPPTFDVSEQEEQSYDDDVEEEAQAFAATANRLTRRRSRSADRAPTGRVNTRARAASASSSRQRSQARSGRKQKLEETSESEEEDDDDYHSPRKTSTKDLLAKIPLEILHLNEDRPEMVARKSLRYIFTEKEILTCMLPPVGKGSQRKPFPPKKVEILYALLEHKFPNLDPITYMRSVKSAVGEHCRRKKTYMISKATSQK